MKYALLCSLVAVWSLSVTAQNATYRYDFHYNLKEQSATGPDMTSQCNGTYNWGSFPKIGTGKIVYNFDKGCGITFNDSNNNLLASGSYTIELFFKLDTINGYKKIIDYNNLGSDKGFYNRSGKLVLYPNFNSDTSFIDSGQYQYVVVTRDGTSKKMHVYYNDSMVGSYTDNSGDYMYGANKHLVFFQDDNGTNNEESSGAVAMIHISNYAMDSTEVKTKYTQLPTTMSISNTFVTQSHVRVYPNPAVDNIHIVTARDMGYYMADITGKVCLANALHKGDNTVAIGNLPTGVYILNLIDTEGNNTKVYKVVKQ